ncbi:hypothetical protein [Methylobacterium sp. 77]|uniref:hypothetical protein n=1 Tax=Methylobacterium sp. 77 TaxID=1101192 RepID=UPI00039E9271|nr:hypothetical protein [Methylobacterium sp. 77]
MAQQAQSSFDSQFSCEQMPLRDQVEAAVQDGTTPISRLLRLMFAVDADATANENLRLRLRARIGAPRIV